MKSRREARRRRGPRPTPIRSFSYQFSLPLPQVSSPLTSPVLRFACFVLLLAGAVSLPAAQPFASYPDFSGALESAAALLDAGDREAAVDAVWERIVAHGQIPFAHGTTAAFLHRGPAGSVAARGDHNAWGTAGDGQMQRVGLSDVWRAVVPLPGDARVDYKLVVDGDWRLDPHNPLQQWGGFGPNSELRMPAYAPSPETVRGDGVSEGTLREAAIVQSERLGYGVRYRVWTPAAYETDGPSDYPILFVTDGHEFADDRLGAALPVLDNLVAEGRITAPVVVFVDPRDPTTGQNRRQEQYVANPGFAAFIADELLPDIDAAYRTAGTRGILGASLGGVCALYFAAERPDVFQRAGSMSPALWAAPELFDAFGPTPASQGFFLSAGTLYDGAAHTRAMRDVLEAVPGFDLAYAERNEGHSWGQWRALVAPMLEALFPPSDVVSVDPDAELEPVALTAWPNPARDHVTLRFSGPAEAPVQVDAFDLLGRRVARLYDGPARAGSVRVDVRGWAAGLYVLRAATPDGIVTRRRLVSP